MLADDRVLSGTRPVCRGIASASAGARLSGGAETTLLASASGTLSATASRLLDLLYHQMEHLLVIGLLFENKFAGCCLMR